jgi:hypothetical protein
MTDISPIRDTILQLLLATKDYTLDRIPNKKDKYVYGLASDSCKDIINQSGLDYNVLIDRLMESRLQCKAVKNPWFGQSTPRRHAYLAHDHALDIVKTLTTRFVTGVSSESKTLSREADTHKV